MTAKAARCRHCSKAKVNRPRGLCWGCYYSPGLKEQYPRGSANPATAKYVGRSNGTEPDPMLAGAPLPVPTAARPGTDEKIAVLAARVARGEQPFHPLDGRTVRRVIVTPATDE